MMLVIFFVRCCIRSTFCVVIDTRGFELHLTYMFNLFSTTFHYP